MAKKHILTDSEIEKDIADAMRNPPGQSEKSYKRLILPAIIIAALLIVIEFLYPLFVLWLVLVATAFAIGYGIFYRQRLKKRIRSVTIRDYIITKETVSSTAEEHYKASHAGRRERISNYTVRFENGKAWCIPGELYGWDEKLRNHGPGIYGTIHRGDTLIVVTQKDRGGIVVAYHTDIFEYSTSQ